MRVLNGVSPGLALLATPFLQISSSTIIPAQNVSQSGLLLPDGPVPKLKLSGGYGAERLPMLSVLMNTVGGLADLAYLPSSQRLRGFRVANLPDYTDIDIWIQPVSPATDIEARFAIDGLYTVLYNMITNNRFLYARFDLLYNDVKVGRVTIDIRDKSIDLKKLGFNHTEVSIDRANLHSSTISPKNTTALEVGLQTFFEFVEPPDKILPQQAFITIMAALNCIAQFPDTDVVEPFRVGAPGFNVQFQSLTLEHKRTEPPFLLYGSLIETLKRIPVYSIEKKRFGGIMIIISFGSDVIGEATLNTGTWDNG